MQGLLTNFKIVGYHLRAVRSHSYHHEQLGLSSFRRLSVHCLLIPAPILPCPSHISSCITLSTVLHYLSMIHVVRAAYRASPTGFSSSSAASSVPASLPWSGLSTCSHIGTACVQQQMCSTTSGKCELWECVKEKNDLSTNIIFLYRKYLGGSGAQDQLVHQCRKAAAAQWAHKEPATTCDDK